LISSVNIEIPRGFIKNPQGQPLKAAN